MRNQTTSILFSLSILVTLLLFNSSQSIARADEATMPPGGAGQASGEEFDLTLAGMENQAFNMEPENPAALVDTSFTYQGLLKSGGVLYNGTCDFLLPIADALSGGTLIDLPTVYNVPVSNGLFSVVVPIYYSIINGNARWMEVRVACPAGSGSYTILSPRYPLVAVPYALGLRMPFAHSVSETSTLFSVTNPNTTNNNPSILGLSAGAEGIKGISTGGVFAGSGVYGETNSTSDFNVGGVYGLSTSNSAGGFFSSASGYGVYGTTASATDFGGYFSNSQTATSGGALYANGDAKQSPEGNGFAKAGVYVYCSDSPHMLRYFNNVNTTGITVRYGGGGGVNCYVNFGFDVSNRYIVATAVGNDHDVNVTFEFYGSNEIAIKCRLDDNTYHDYDIMILVY